MSTWEAVLEAAVVCNALRADASPNRLCLNTKLFAPTAK
jgi:hypothetical protein